MVLSDKEKIIIIIFSIILFLIYDHIPYIISNNLFIVAILIHILIIAFLIRKIGGVNAYLLKEGKYKKAIERLLKGNTSSKVSLRKKFWIASLYYLLGYNSNAKKYYEELMEANYKFGAMYYLPVLLFADEKEISKSWELLEKGRKYEQKFFIFFKKSIYIEAKAWLFFLQKENEKATKLYEELLKNYEKHGANKIKCCNYLSNIIFYHFGIILKHKGEYEKALEYFKKSIKAGGPESIFSKRSEEEIRKIVNGEW